MEYKNKLIVIVISLGLLSAVIIFSWAIYQQNQTKPDTPAVAVAVPQVQQAVIHVPIDVVADNLDTYLQVNSRYPDSLDAILGDYTVTPKYTYLAKGLTADCPDQLILLYETDPDEKGWRNVLFAGRARQYHIRGEIVSRKEYEKEYEDLMAHRDPEETMLTDDAVLQIDWSTGRWYTRCDFELKRIIKLNEIELKQALQLDSQLRNTVNQPK